MQRDGIPPALPVLLLALLGGCVQQGETEFLFEKLEAARTGIDFANVLRPTEELNTYLFRNFYNGGGVAIGDIDNDGRKDVFFTGNQVSSRLYLNKGDFRFEDITDESGLASDGIWTTGVSMADINGDGWLDIYLCKSGPPGGARRHNELFINNTDRTFTEQAEAYGLAVSGLSIHASFLDYDADGDLDMYLLSNPVRSLDEMERRSGLRAVRDPHGGNRLFRNELVGDHFATSAPVPFSDVTGEAGIYSSGIGFGLGANVGGGRS